MRYPRKARVGGAVLALLLSSVAIPSFAQLVPADAAANSDDGAAQGVVGAAIDATGGAASQAGADAEPVIETIKVRLVDAVEVDPNAAVDSAAVKVRANLGDLLQEPRGRGLDPVLITGTVVGLDQAGTTIGRVEWSGLELEEGTGGTDDTSKQKSATLKEPMASAFSAATGSVAEGTPVSAKGDVNSLIEQARALLDGTATGIDGDGTADENGAGLTGQDGSNGADGSSVGGSSGSGTSGSGSSGTGSGVNGSTGSGSSGSGSSGTGSGVNGSTGSGSSGSGSSGTGSGVNGSTGSGSSGSGSSGTGSGVNGSTGSGSSGSGSSGTGSGVNGSTGSGSTIGGGTPGSGLNGSDGTSGSGGAGSGSGGTVGSGDGLEGDGTTGSGGTLNPGSGDDVGDGTGTDDGSTSASFDVVSTSEGCQLRRAPERGTMIQQFKAQYFLNGVLDHEDGCSDSFQEYKIQTTRNGCTDKVSLTDSTAWPQERTYYLDETSVEHPLDECAPVADEAYPIIVTENGCSPRVDELTENLYEQARKIYVNGNNTEIEVAGCMDKGGAVKLTRTTAGCSWRHDLEAGISYEQSALYWPKSTGNLQMSACSDDGVTAIQKTTTNGCTPQVDLTNGVVIQQFRTYVTLPDATQLTLSDCAPSTTTEQLKADKASCSTTFTNDPLSGKSYGTQRLYYDFGAGIQYVTTCATDKTTVYNWEVSYSYEMHDDKLSSREYAEYWITTPAGHFKVQNATLTTGKFDPYVSLGQEEKVIETTWDECARLEKWAMVTTYRRPDGTTLENSVPTKSTNTDGCGEVIKTQGYFLSATINNQSYEKYQGKCLYDLRNIRQNGLGEEIEGDSVGTSTETAFSATVTQDDDTHMDHSSFSVKTSVGNPTSPVKYYFFVNGGGFKGTTASSYLGWASAGNCRDLLYP